MHRLDKDTMAIAHTLKYSYTHIHTHVLCTVSHQIVILSGFWCVFHVVWFNVVVVAYFILHLYFCLSACVCVSLCVYMCVLLHCINSV